MPIIRELVTRLGFDVRDDGARKYEQRIDKIKSDLQKVGVISAAAATALVLPAAAVEENVARALTLMGVTGDQFEQMRDRMIADAFRMARELGTSASQISSGYYDVLSAGVTPVMDGFEELLATATKLSRTTGLELPQSVELVTTTVKQFGLEVKDAARVTDLLFGATRPVQVTLPQLAQSLREASVAAGSVNTDLPTTLALLDALAEKGIRANVAGTALRIIFTRMSAATGQAAKTLERLGIRTIDPVTGQFRDMFDVLNDLRRAINALPPAQRNLALKTIAGEEAFAKLGAILATSDERLRSLRSEIDGATGALDDADSIIRSTTRFALERFGSSLKNVAGILGGQLSKDTGEFINTLSDALDTLGDFLERNPEFVEAAANLTKIALAVGLLGIAMKNLDKIILASKLGLLLLAIDEILAFFTEREGLVESVVNRAAAPLTEQQKSKLDAFRARRQAQLEAAQRVSGGAPALFPGAVLPLQRPGASTTTTNVDRSVQVNINGPVTKEVVDRAAQKFEEVQRAADGL